MVRELLTNTFPDAAAQGVNTAAPSELGDVLVHVNVDPGGNSVELTEVTAVHGEGGDWQVETVHGSALVDAAGEDATSGRSMRS